MRRNYRLTEKEKRPSLAKRGWGIFDSNVRFPNVLRFDYCQISPIPSLQKRGTIKGHKQAVRICKTFAKNDRLQSKKFYKVGKACQAKQPQTRGKK